MTEIPVHPLIKLRRDQDGPGEHVPITIQTNLSSKLEPLPRIAGARSTGSGGIYMVHNSWLVISWVYAGTPASSEEALIELYETSRGHPTPDIRALGNAPCAAIWKPDRLQLFRTELSRPFLQEAPDWTPPTPGRYNGAVVTPEPGVLQLWINLSSQ